MTIRLYLTEKLPALFKRKKGDVYTTTMSDKALCYRRIVIYKNGEFYGWSEIKFDKQNPEQLSRFENTIKLMLK